MTRGGPIAALLPESTGSWMSVFAVIIALNLAPALPAITVLKPMRACYLESYQAVDAPRLVKFTN